jgi:hypothetical protein
MARGACAAGFQLLSQCEGCREWHGRDAAHVRPRHPPQVPTVPLNVRRGGLARVAKLCAGTGNNSVHRWSGAALSRSIFNQSCSHLLGRGDLLGPPSWAATAL